MLTPDDLKPFADIAEDKAQAMIDDAMSYAVMVAPCILDPVFEHTDAVKAILRGAILRWNDAGSGAYQSEQAGVYGVTYDTRQQRRPLLWPTEIRRLQSLCRDQSGAFSVDTAPTGVPLVHADICSVNLGALYCSCGAILTAHAALWET